MLGSYWDHFCIMLGSFWHHFGITLGSCWHHLGIVLGSVWDQFWKLFFPKYIDKLPINRPSGCYVNMDIKDCARWSIQHAVHKAMISQGSARHVISKAGICKEHPLSMLYSRRGRPGWRAVHPMCHSQGRDFAGDPSSMLYSITAAGAVDREFVYIFQKIMPHTDPKLIPKRSQNDAKMITKIHQNYATNIPK